MSKDKFNTKYTMCKHDYAIIVHRLIAYFWQKWNIYRNVNLTTVGCWIAVTSSFSFSTKNHICVWYNHSFYYLKTFKAFVTEYLYLNKLPINHLFPSQFGKGIHISSSLPNRLELANLSCRYHHAVIKCIDGVTSYGKIPIDCPAMYLLQWSTEFSF